MSYYPLTPHKYPSWITISFKICFFLFVMCLFSFPYYFKLNDEVKRARSAFKNKNYKDASIYYKELSLQLPRNKNMKLYLAQSLFKSNAIEDHVTALKSLEMVELNKSEWAELLNYMPTQYVECFNDVKKRNRA